MAIFNSYVKLPEGMTPSAQEHLLWKESAKSFALLRFQTEASAELLCRSLSLVPTKHV